MEFSATVVPPAETQVQHSERWPDKHPDERNEHSVVQKTSLRHEPQSARQTLVLLDRSPDLLDILHNNRRTIPQRFHGGHADPSHSVSSTQPGEWFWTSSC